jgi:N-acetylglucosaminyldiphosphoundecaprenol N-acetyl-beta-D-mannosaminyltransferase
VRIGPIWIDALSFEDAVLAIDALAAAGRGGAVFTPNVDHVVAADRNPDLRDAYAAADLALADGQWVVWASRILGTPLPGKISGSDLALPLARRAAQQGRSIFLLGGAPGAGEQAAERLTRETGVRIAGLEAPRVDLDAPDAALVDRIATTRPAFILVALGAPKQELWIRRNLDRLRPSVLVGVGATLDFLAGRVLRAPRWISAAGAEWLFRLALEPRRLARRYLVDDPRFAAIVLRTLREPRAERVQHW